MKREAIIHFFPKEKFTDGYINFVNENFDKEKHFFWVYGKLKYEVKTIVNENVIYKENITSFFKENKEVLYNSEKIIFHSIFSFDIFMWLFFHKRYLKKTFFVFWGGDLYCYRKKEKGIKALVKNPMRKFVINNLVGYINLIPEDRKLLEEFFEPKGNAFLGVYSSQEDNRKLEQCLKRKLEMDSDKGSINIQVGNSATKNNRHIEIFEKLKPFKEEDIKVYVPLSYGDERYRDEVIEYGKKVLGEKFIPMLEFMDFEQYSEYLSKIDIAIFNNDRQQAMGNINYLAYLGCKVYLADDMPMWNYYKNYVKCQFSSINSITTLSFEEFKEIGKDIQDRNRAAIEWLHSRERAIELWEKVFES